MIPDEKEHAERLAARLKAYANLNLQKMIYELCCELQAIAAAALLARVYWVLELTDAKPGVTTQDRMQMIHLLAGSVRVGTVANKAGGILESLVRDAATKEVQRIVAYQASPKSPKGLAGIDRFCEMIADGSVGSTDETFRDYLQRMYNLGVDKPGPSP